MKQFYETYTNQLQLLTLLQELKLMDHDKVLKLSALPTVLKDHDRWDKIILTALLTEISWTAHLEILSGCASPEEKLFYLLLAKKERWSYRELKRRIASSAFERTAFGNLTIKAANGTFPLTLENVFKDSYVLEFLNLPDRHNESDLQKAIVSNIKKFILELGRDFAFMGDEYPVQVGNQDFFIDLVFYSRALNCLVAIELKTEKFAPEHMGQINFYLEARDRDVKKSHENPSIGILLCKGKDDVVVEYALSRTLNPAMIADYKTKLPNKKLLQEKWQEILESGEKSEKL